MLELLELLLLRAIVIIGYPFLALLAWLIDDRHWRQATRDAMREMWRGRR